MKGVGGPLETPGNMVTGGLEDETQIDFWIVTHLLQEDTEVGVQAPIHGNRLFLQNVTGKVHLIEEENSRPLILALQVTAEEGGLLQRLMKKNYEPEGARGLVLQMISLAPSTKMKKSCRKSLSVERERGPGQYLWMRSLREEADHPREKWMKADPGTGSGLGQILWMISTASLSNWRRTEIENQGIMTGGTLDQDLQKIGIKLMPERMKENMESQNIGIIKGPGQNLLKGSIVLKINQVKIEIRNQSIVIEGVQGQYH